MYVHPYFAHLNLLDGQCVMLAHLCLKPLMCMHPSERAALDGCCSNVLALVCALTHFVLGVCARTPHQVAGTTKYSRAYQSLMYIDNGGVLRDDLSALF